MRLNAARHDDLPFRVDRAASMHRWIVDADVRDLFTADAYRPTSNSLRCDDLAIANHYTNIGYGVLKRCTGS
jgi:hypothetical protein